MILCMYKTLASAVPQMAATRRRICCTRKESVDPRKKPTKLARRKTRKILPKIKLNELSLNCKTPKSTFSKSGPSMKTKWRSVNKTKPSQMDLELAEVIPTPILLKIAPRPMVPFPRQRSTAALA